MTTSPTHPGVLWTHGDSGSGNWLFAVDASGEVLARLRVRGTVNVDWEDITHDDQGRLWLGDIGNNDSNRRDLAVHRMPEPDPSGAGDNIEVELSVPYHFPEQTRFGKRGDNFDAEALFWWREQLWLLTKHRSDDNTRLYRFPELSGEAVGLEQVASFDMGPSIDASKRKPWSGQVSAAEVSEDGRYLAMLTYEAVFVFATPASGEGAEMFDEQVAHVAFDQALTGQVEALTWVDDGLIVFNEARAVFRIDDPLTRSRYSPK